MRYLSGVLAAVVVLQSFCTAAYALPISYTQAESNQPASVACHLPCPSIGPLLLKNGSVKIEGAQIDVAAVPEWLFDAQVVLSGAVINVQLDTSGPKTSITGLAYFNKGDWLTNLGSTVAKDLIYTTNGEAFTAQVGGITDGALEVLPADGNRRKVPFSEIRDIRSPRAWHFNIPASGIKLPPGTGTIDADAQRLSFSPSGALKGRLAAKPAAPKSNLPGTEGAVSNKAIATWVALDIANDLAPIITGSIMYPSPFRRQRQLLRQFGNFSISGDPFNPFPTQAQLTQIFGPH